MAQGIQRIGAPVATVLFLVALYALLTANPPVAAILAASGLALVLALRRAARQPQPRPAARARDLRGITIV